MALVLADRVQEITTTSGTGTITLNGAVPGFQDFATGVGSGNETYYTIYDPTTYAWEVGIGTFTSSGTDTLSRDTVLSNSLGTTAKINLAGNQTNVFVTYPSEKSVNLNTDGVMEVGEPISYADTGIISTFASTVAGYNQVVVQNKSTATNASANLNVSNDASTSSNGFAELGINSSTFSNGPGCFNIPGAAYVASAGTDLAIGTYNAYNIHFATNSSTTDAMTIFDNGGTSLGGYGNPGIGNLAVNKIVSGITETTASGGTTALVAASTYYQRVVGTTTHTIQLPDATTLLNGTTFIVDNDSTGNVTVTNFATASLDVLPSGGLSYLYLTDNSTVAGTWTTHGYLPSIYNFNNTVADFANATIINAVWNGTTIGTGYGGTGLTTFGGADNALYSTGASTLTAGTLPPAAGGTGLTSLTTNYVPYGNGTSPYQSSASFTYDGTTLSASNYTTPGNLTFTGTGNRITGDFSNATIANRVAFQTSTTNGSTTIMVLPNGTGPNTQLLLRGSSAAQDDSFGQVVLAGGSDFRIASGASGTGTYLPMTFYTVGSERMRIDTSGRVLFGTTTAPTGSGAGSITANSMFLSDGANAVLYSNGSSGGTFLRSGDPSSYLDNLVITSVGNTTIRGTLSVNSGVASGGDALVVNQGGDLRIYNAGNTNSSIFYCDAPGLIYNDQRLVNSSFYFRLNGTFAGANATGAQSMFGVGVTLEANTIYEIEILLMLNKTAGTTSHTLATTFGGTATLNNIAYTVWGAAGAIAFPLTVQTGQVAAALTTTALVIKAATTTAAISTAHLIKGTVSVNASGTFIPQYVLSAAPGGAYTTQIGSYVKLTKLGQAGGNINVGGWA